MDSLSIKEFSQSIIDLANKTQLPMEVKRLVFVDILGQIDIATNEEIKMQVINREKEKESESE